MGLKAGRQNLASSMLITDQSTSKDRGRPGDSFYEGRSPTLCDLMKHKSGGIKQENVREAVNRYMRARVGEKVKMSGTLPWFGEEIPGSGFSPEFPLSWGGDVNYHFDRPQEFVSRELHWKPDLESVSGIKPANFDSNGSVPSGFYSRGLDQGFGSLLKTEVNFDHGFTGARAALGSAQLGSAASNVYGIVEPLGGSGFCTAVPSVHDYGSERMMEVSSSDAFASQSGNVNSSFANAMPNMNYELVDLDSTRFSYSSGVCEERVATNDNCSEPMDCVMADFQSAMVPDAMSPALGPMFKRGSWDLVNDGFDLLSNGSVPESSGGFSWQKDGLVSNVSLDVRNSVPTTLESLLAGHVPLPNVLPAVGPFSERSSPKLPLASTSNSVQPNLLPCAGVSVDNHVGVELRGGEAVLGHVQVSRSISVPPLDVTSSQPSVGGALPAEKYLTSDGTASESKKELAEHHVATREANKVAEESTERAKRMMTGFKKLAESLETEDTDASQLALEAVEEFCSEDGDYMQRVSHYFRKALSFRLTADAGTGDEGSYQLPHDLLEDYKFVEAGPFSKFAHLTANQALLEAVEGAEYVHIIDVGTMQHVQFSSLVQALVCPADTKGPSPPKKVRISTLASLKAGVIAQECLHHTGRRLTDFADGFGLEIEFQPIFGHVHTLSAESFCIREGEVVVVNLMLQLHGFLAEGSEKVTEVIKLVQSLEPKVVVVGEYESGVDEETADGQSRLLDAIKHYLPFFECLEILPRDCQHRQRIEKYILGREIRDKFCTTIEKGAKRFKSFTQWKVVLEGLGLQPLKPSHYAHSQARLLLWMFEGEPYKVINNSGFLGLSWRDRAVITVSAWHFS